MKKFWTSLYWVRVFFAYLIAFSILAFIVSMPLGAVGFWSGYIGWPILLSMFVLELDSDTKEALKKWASTRKGGEDHE